MRTRLAALAALVIIPVAGCSVAAHRVPVVPAAPVAPTTLVATNARPACTGSVVVVIGMDAEVPCDVTPPQRLDVNGVTIAECDDMGGEPIAVTLPMDGLINCEGVDY